MHSKGLFIGLFSLFERVRFRVAFFRSLPTEYLSSKLLGCFSVFVRLMSMQAGFASR